MIKARKSALHASRPSRPSRLRVRLSLSSNWRSLLAPGVVLAQLAGCATQPEGGGIRGVELTRTVTIPAQRAHTKFQAGRQVSGVDYSEPYCELEIKTVSEQPRQVPAGSFRVRRQSQTLLKDAITRIPALLAGFSCNDDLYQESIWWLDGDEPDQVTYLRCLAPYFNCRIGAPLSPEQVQQVVGQRIRINTE